MWWLICDATLTGFRGSGLIICIHWWLTASSGLNWVKGQWDWISCRIFYGFMVDKLNTKSIWRIYEVICQCKYVFVKMYWWGKKKNIALFAQVLVQPTTNNLRTTLGGADTPSAVRWGWLHTRGSPQEGAIWSVCHAVVADWLEGAEISQ